MREVLYMGVDLGEATGDYDARVLVRKAADGTLEVLAARITQRQPNPPENTGGTRDE
jgi:hypothetical protein